MIKWCPSCQKEAETYTKFKCPYCKVCWRAYSKRYTETRKVAIQEINRKSWHKNKDKYNLARKLGGASLFSELLLKQNNVCAICSNPETSKRYRSLSVDHDHSTGKIRGLLCSNCNRALGLLKDDILVLKKAIDYLNENK